METILVCWQVRKELCFSEILPASLFIGTPWLYTFRLFSNPPLLPPPFYSELESNERSRHKIYIKNLHKLLLEVFKTQNYLSPSYLWDLFSVRQVKYNQKTKILVISIQIKA